MSEMTVTDMHRMGVITVGEPGCYVLPGHLPLDTFAKFVHEHCLGNEDWIDDELADLEPARHTWMVLTHDAWEGETYYREVLPGTDGAQPYTMIAVKGYWKHPEATL